MPHGVYPRLSPERRFWAKVDPCRTDNCMIWVASAPQGYGQFYWDGKVRRAHHFLVGLPPTGMEWDHVKAKGCLHTECVWPDHLELVTHRENQIRGSGFTSRNLAKTHCAQGHEFTEANTYWHGPTFNKRKCLTCNKIHNDKQNALRTQRNRELKP